jgi:hypothetical protein
LCSLAQKKAHFVTALGIISKSRTANSLLEKRSALYPVSYLLNQGGSHGRQRQRQKGKQEKTKAYYQGEEKAQTGKEEKQIAPAGHLNQSPHFK